MTIDRIRRYIKKDSFSPKLCLKYESTQQGINTMLVSVIVSSHYKILILFYRGNKKIFKYNAILISNNHHYIYVCVYIYTHTQVYIGMYMYIYMVLYKYISKEQVSFNFTVAVTIHSDFGAQENKICHCFHFFPFHLLWSDGMQCYDTSF